MKDYLASTECIDWQDPTVRDCAARLKPAGASPEIVARSCFEWVRDHIRHTGDARDDVTTVTASDVLREGTGWCFAKSHLLAALLRANGLRAGLCYQRLQFGDGVRYTLHGLNAVHLPGHGWYRIDPRGNKPGVEAGFDPPREILAWTATEPGEENYRDVRAEPLPVVVDCLRTHSGWQSVMDHLPDFKM